MNSILEPDDKSPAETSTTEKTYFQRWYEKEGRKLNRRRKKKYKEDPDYKAKVLEQNKAMRKRRALERAPEKIEEKKARGKLRTKINWKSYQVPASVLGNKAKKGQKITVFTVGAAATMLGCSEQAIRLWEKKGVLPKPLRYKKDRVYTKAQIDKYKKSLEQLGRIGAGQRKVPILREIFKTVRFADGETKEVGLFRIGELAKASQRTVVTLEQLEAKEALPKTPFRNPTATGEPGTRFYTFEQIKAVKKAFEKRAWEVRGKEEWQRLYDEVFEAWEKLGVIGASIVTDDVENTDAKVKDTKKQITKQE